MVLRFLNFTLQNNLISIFAYRYGKAIIDLAYHLFFKRWVYGTAYMKSCIVFIDFY